MWVQARRWGVGVAYLCGIPTVDGPDGSVGQASGEGFPGAHTSPEACGWVAAGGACREGLERVA